MKNKNLSSYQAEKQFGIPRRTIANKVKLLHMKKIGSPVRLCEDDEKKNCKCFNTMWGIWMSTNPS